MSVSCALSPPRTLPGTIAAFRAFREAPAAPIGFRVVWAHCAVLALKSEGQDAVSRPLIMRSGCEGRQSPGRHFRE